MKYKYYLAIFAFIPLLGSCSFLDEDPSHIGTAETTFTTASGLELALNACYSSLRDVHYDKTLWLAGTDLFGKEGIPSSDFTSTGFEVYSEQTHTADNKVFYNFWTNCYKAINRTNIVINQCKDIAMDEKLRSKRIAEAYVLRALFYYYLVEQFGDIPLLLSDTQDIITTAERIKEQEVYKQIITDIENNKDFLDWEVDDFGRVGKGYAYGLLSKLYLTRGYKTYAESTDFEKSAFYAQEVINKKDTYKLLEDYGKIFEPGNEENDEIIFSVQYSDDMTLNGTGNNTHVIFGSYDRFVGMDRSTRYNRRLNYFSESFFLLYLYGVNSNTGKPILPDIELGFIDGTSIINLNPLANFRIDKRFDGTFLRTILADKDAKNYSPQLGADPKNANVKKTIMKDEIAVFMPYPNEPWTYAQVAEVNYQVLNHTMYHRRTSDEWAGDAQNSRPIINKFWEPGRYDDAKGVRDLFLMRLGEVYLLAAEAYYKNGQAQLSADCINELRKRAYGNDWNDSYKISPEEVDIDFILDESGRELAGESHRWVDLKRTGKLVERVLKYNLQAGHINTSFISEKHYLRPLPFEWTSRLQNKVEQNPGY